VSNTSLSSATSSTFATLSLTTIGVSQVIRNMATGLRINRAADGPAQLISSENLRATLAFLDGQVSSLQRTNEASAVADAALGEVSDLLTEAGSIEVQLANEGALSSSERSALQGQLDSILTEVDRIGSSTSFNGQSLLGGSTTFRVGRDTLDLGTVSTMQLGQLEINGRTARLSDVGSSGMLADDASNAASVIDAAASEVAVERARIGNFQSNTIETRIDVFNAAIESLAAAEAVGRGANLASEAADLVRLQTLNAASLRTLSIANENQKEVLSLLL